MADEDRQLIADFDRLAEGFARARVEIERHVIGQRTVVDLTLAALLAGGHALMIGLPGLAKTRLVKTIGAVLALDTRRVQFTPDLIPADILGSEVLETGADGARGFRFLRGPIFAQLLMADEINRASPRTQSALLEAMQEGQITVAGTTYGLPVPFHVLATQNPIEQDGTYPLPEAQLDRFLLSIPVDYPSLNDERAILLATTSGIESEVLAVLEPGDLRAAQAIIPRMPVPAGVVDAVLAVTRALRPPGAPHILWGPGPRGSQALLMAARAHAFLRGAKVAILDDVGAVMRAALAHRLQLTYAARADGRTVSELIAREQAAL